MKSKEIIKDIDLQAANPIIYYLSSSTGDDGNNGTSPSTPWRNLAKASSIIFNPGDRILLRRCDVWNEGIQMHGSGTSGNYIELGAYGSGARPMINLGGAKEQFCVIWEDAHYAKVSSISVCNAGMGIRIGTADYHENAFNIIDDCIAYNIDGLYWGELPEGTFFTTGIYVIGKGNQIKNCEIFRGAANMGVYGYDCTIQNAYIHEIDSPNCAYQTLTACGGHNTLRNIVLENQPWYAPMGTAAVGIGCYDDPPQTTEYSLLDHIIIRNVKWSGFPPGDTCGIDFDENVRYLTLQNCVFENIAGAGIEFLRGGGTVMLSSGDIEIKNNKFINCNYERPVQYCEPHVSCQYYPIQVVNWRENNKPLNVSIHDNEYVLTNGNTDLFGGDGDTSGCSVYDNTEMSSIAYDHEPIVEAGADRNIFGTSSIKLSDASVGDDGEKVTVKWEQFMGPNGGEATFDDDSNINPTVTFPQDGTYILRLKVSDTYYFKTDYVTVKVDNSSIKTLKDETCSESLIQKSTTWDFNVDADTEGWTVGNHVNEVTIADGCYTGNITGSDPYIYSPDNLHIDLTNNRIITLCMKNSTSARYGKLYFTTYDDSNWDENKVIHFDIEPNDSIYRIYKLDFEHVRATECGLLSRGRGIVKQLRLDPEEGAPGGSFSIDFIRFKQSGPKPFSVLEYYFNADGNTKGWSEGNHIDNTGVFSSCYFGRIIGSDHWLDSPDNLNVDLDCNKLIRLCLKNCTESMTAALYFTTASDLTWDRAKVKQFQLIKAEDSIRRVYEVDMSSVPGWTGTLKQLRLDPGEGAVSGSFGLEFIKILPLYNKTWRFDTNAIGENEKYTDVGLEYVRTLPTFNNNWASCVDGNKGSWTTGNQASNDNATGDSYNGEIISAGLRIYSPDNINLDISKAKFVIVRLKNSTSGKLGELCFTTTTDQTWDVNKSRAINIIPDSDYTIYVLDMWTNPYWSGTLKQLRINLEEGSKGSFGIDYVVIKNR